MNNNNNNLDDIFASHLGDVKPVQQPTQTSPTPVKAQAVALRDNVTMAVTNKNISDKLLANFDKLAQEGQLTFPKGYQVGNELKYAYSVIVSNPKASQCTAASIANTLIKMVTLGLSAQKDQVYFIPYDNQLNCQVSYFGSVASAKRTGLIVDVNARVIYDGDEYEIETDELGNECVKNHKTRLENHDNPIKGAYAWAIGISGYKLFCVMSKKEIEANWNMSKDNSRKFQKQFPQQAAKRTVINRLMSMISKTAVNMTEEQNQAINTYLRSVEDEYVSNQGDYKYNNSNTINAHVQEKTGEILDEDLLD